MQRVQLIGDDQVDLPGGGGGIQLRRGFGRGTKFRPAMHHMDARRDILQRQRPIHRGIAAAGDHHAFIAKIIPPAHIVLHGARGLERF